MIKIIKNLIRTKPIDAIERHVSLKRCLTTFDLTMLGIGAIIGAGIFVITGIAAATKAGPAVVLSYILAGFAAGFSALAYAELAACIGGCGSAYGYAYIGFGEIFAWVIGWSLILEYGLSTATVAIGWSGYVSDFFSAIGWHIPDALAKCHQEGGIINLPAMAIVLFIATILMLGVKQSARVNSVMVITKLAVILFFIVVASTKFNSENWHPFFPFGWHGVVNGAGLIFFAYIGFDAVSTAAEEALQPQRSMPRGIIISLAICTIIYMIVSGLLTGIAPYYTLNVSSPVAQSLLRLNLHKAAGVISVGAIIGLTTVILVMFYGLTRVCLAMSRDNLLPYSFAKISNRTHTPARLIFFGGLVMSIIAGAVPITHVAHLVNIGTLAAFTLVCMGVIVLRYKHPDLPRPFKTPYSPLIPILGALLCLYLMSSLPAITWISFFIWSAIGLVIYFAYSKSHSALG